MSLTTVFDVATQESWSRYVMFRDMFSSANLRRKIIIPQTQQNLQIVQPSARTQNDGPRMLAQTLPEQDNQPTIIDGPEKA